MARIHVLPDEVINKIAAGEVVERPASVVKELVENALDAGAREIRVTLELGGTRSIVVTDDGCGLNREDALLAVRRHATSKISAADDLFNIHTMGFRGEALASIASVSRFSLATREQNAPDGVRIRFEDGAEPLVHPWSGPAGTTVSVENLFYNLPVRARFLKAPATEFSHCLELIQAISLCRPDVTFSLSHNNREVFRAVRVNGSPREDGWQGEAVMIERARALLGKDADNLLYVRTEGRHGRLEGLISPPGTEKGTGRHMYNFVNGRWVRDKLLRFAVLRGYHSHLLRGRFPVVMLHLRLDPALVDVNVHPAKSELRFQYPDEISSLIALAIREKLRDGQWSAPRTGAELPVPADTHEPDEPAPVSRSASRPPSPMPAAASARPLAFGAMKRQDSGGAPAVQYRSRFDGQPSSGGGAGDAFAQTPIPSVQSAADLERVLADLPAGKAVHSAPKPGLSEKSLPVDWQSLNFCGSYANCYLFFSDGSRLLVVDQHAFHERIIFERLLRDRSLLTRSQRLLVPEAVQLSPTEAAGLMDRAAELHGQGFEFSRADAATIEVHAVPALLAGRDIASLVATLATGYDAAEQEVIHTTEELSRLTVATIACHAAVRAGENLTEGDLRQLIREAGEVDFYHNCPHGRRVFRWFDQTEVARWFDR